MFTTKQQTTIYHSIWTTRSNYITTWRLVLWIAIIGTCTGGINGQEITKITDEKDILDVSIKGGHGSIYTLPKGAQMWHGTPADFTYLRAKPAWFAARYDQSLRHGFMNFANRAGNTDILGTLQDTIDAAVKTGDKVKIDQAWTDALNHPIFFEDGVARTKPIKLIIKSCKPNVDLKLLFLNYDDAKNVAKFKQVVGTKKTDGSQIYNKAGLIGELSTNVINAVQHPDSQFCTTYNGWRNPFDQDEIMICPNVLYNVICMYQDEIILAEYYKICGSFFPVAFNQEANVVSGVRQQRNWMHVVGNPQCKLTYEEAKKLPAKVRVGDKYDNQAFEDLWNDRPRPLSAILAVGGKATLAPPAQAKPVIAANKGKPGPLVSLLQQHQRFKIRRQQQTLQP